MATTLATALLAVRERLDEATAREWGDVPLRRWLMEGSRDVARKTFALFDQVDVALTLNVPEYTAPTNILHIHMAEWLPGDGRRIPMLGRSREAMPWGPSQDQMISNPVYYTWWGFPPTLKIKVYPVPYINSTLRLFVSRLPAVLLTDGTNDGSNLDFPEGWIEVLYDYCEYRALRKDQDPRWQESKALYDEQIINMHQYAMTYIRDTGEVTREGLGYGAGYWFLDPSY